MKTSLCYLHIFISSNIYLPLCPHIEDKSMYLFILSIFHTLSMASSNNLHNMISCDVINVNIPCNPCKHASLCFLFLAVLRSALASKYAYTNWILVMPSMQTLPCNPCIHKPCKHASLWFLFLVVLSSAPASKYIQYLSEKISPYIILVILNLSVKCFSFTIYFFNTFGPSRPLFLYFGLFNTQLTVNKCSI